MGVQVGVLPFEPYVWNRPQRHEIGETFDVWPKVDVGTDRIVRRVGVAGTDNMTVPRLRDDRNRRWNKLSLFRQSADRARGRAWRARC